MDKSEEIKDLDKVEPIDYGVIAKPHTPVYKMHRFFARRPYSVFNELIRHYSNPGSIVLDPMCGGGVTIIEGLRLRRKVIGVDLNPMATFITKMEAIGVDLDKLKQEKPFPEKLETIVFDKTEIARQYHGELLQTALQNDPEMQQWFESLWQQDINQITIDLVEDGKKNGYINPKRSQEALMLYLEILRRGVFASSDLLANLEPNVELLRELNFLFIHGMMGKIE